MKSLALDFSKDKQQMNWQNFLKVIRRDLWLLPITPWGQVPTQTVVQSNFSFEKWANQLQIYTNKIDSWIPDWKITRIKINTLDYKM